MLTLNFHTKSGAAWGRLVRPRQASSRLHCHCTVRTDCPTECPTDRTPAAAALTLADTHHNLAKH